MEKNVPLKIQEYVQSELPKSASNSEPLDDFKKRNLNNFSLTNGSDTVNNIKNCKKTLFNEPEIPNISPITPEEFSKIPKYIIGRLTIDTLNSLILSINHIIKSKYSVILLGKNGARKKGELDLYLHYKKEQMSLGPDEGNLN